MTRRSHAFGVVLLAGGLAASAAVLAVLSLSAVTKPAGFAVRLAAVQRETTAARQLAVRARSADALPAATLCPGATSAEAQRLSAELGAVLAAQGLVSPRVQVRAGRDTGGPLAPLSVRIETSGPYDAALAGVARLAAVRPMLLIDTVDLNSKTAFVTLSITGRVLCSARRS